jgi:hypothetical protein
LWLKEGDRNSKFFHLSTLVCRWRNQISEILLDDGRWINLREEIVSYFTSHFGDIYHSSQPSIPQDLESLLSPYISEAENSELSRIPEPEEIRMVV